MNKHFYITLLVAMTIIHGSAQDRSFNPMPVIKKSILNQKAEAKASRSVIDTTTVFFPTWDDECSDELTNFLPTNAWGRVSGMNEFLDQAKAQRLEFTASDSYTILGGIGLFSQAVVLGDGMLKMDFYTADANGAPGDLLSSSNSIKTSDIALPDTFTAETFFIIPADARPTLTDPSFFASVDLSALYEAEDSVALFQTVEDCGDGLNTYESILTTDGDTAWVSIQASWDNLNADFAIAAIVEFDDATSDESFIRSQGLILYPVYPNPTVDNIVLTYELERSGPVTISIFDGQGKLIQRNGKENIAAGHNTQEVHLNQFSPGTYFYMISTDQGRIASRFVVD